MTNELAFSVADAEAHLRKVDPMLIPIMERQGPYKPSLRDNPYASLLRAILFQQLAGAAASAIQRRLYSIHGEPDQTPTPEQILSTTEEQMRAAGVSRQKEAYIRDLALHVVEGKLDFDDLPSLPDEEVIKRLIAVKGIGEWSAHMFLMFHLGRPDVLPIGDLGVRNGMKITYGLDSTPTPTLAKEIGAPWAPFRSVGSWYMWRVVAPITPDI